MDALITGMTSALYHRGPDSGGHWEDHEAGVSLGHRRLSILDLSQAGHQPMASPSGRYMITFNGEIYNHLSLRAMIEEAGHQIVWRGSSDTETLLACFDVFGIRETVVRAVGMFAFAVWDREQRDLTLCRDRMGEKPLYFGWTGAGRDRRLVFASQLSALWGHPGVRDRIDRAAIADLLRHRCVIGTRSIFEGIRKVAPGTLVTISDLEGTCQEGVYWSPLEVLADREVAPWTEGPEAAVDHLEALLLDVVQGQMISDVPIGAFLSGGIDSSLVSALMQAIAKRPVMTFSIGFDIPNFDEAPFARNIADHLGTEHTEVYVNEQDLLDLVPALPAAFDEPFADSSQIPTMLLAQITRPHVTVALSGDGGDEIFGGYDRYRKGAALSAQFNRLPLGLRHVAAAAARGAPDAAMTFLLGLVRPVANGKEPGGQWARRMGDYLASGSVDELHRKLVSFWRAPLSGIHDAQASDDVVRVLPADLNGLSPEERMMADDMRAYLPDDILAKVDRATMAASLESRAPLLDHRVFEFAARLPLDVKIRGDKGKWILREVLARHVPRDLFERPKMGFESPIGAWIRGPLKGWAGDLLSSQSLRESGYLNADCIETMWQQHLEGRAEWGHQLWSVLMFEAWYRHGQNPHEAAGPVAQAPGSSLAREERRVS